MTFSIVGRSPDGSALGVAVASKFLAAGGFVPAAEVGAGAVATQSYANLAYKPEGLAAMRAGRTAAEALAALTARDDMRAERQAGLVDHRGGSATFTGDSCHPWAGGLTGGGPEGSFAAQGNMLAGPEVVEAMAAAWGAGAATALPRRLLAALQAGEDAGGDPRGRQSAGLLVVKAGAGYGGASDSWVDLRSDDHPEPIPELLRMLDLHDLYFGRSDPDDLLPLTGDLQTEVGRRLSALGYHGEDVSRTLYDWMGVENYEERFVDGLIDPIVLTKLREAAGG